MLQPSSTRIPWPSQLEVWKHGAFSDNMHSDSYYVIFFRFRPTVQPFCVYSLVESTKYMWTWLEFFQKQITFNLKCTGANDFGQLGDGTEESAKEPKKVNALATEFVKSVSCGAHCTAAIAEPRENDGTISRSRLWVWGQNQVCLN